MDDKKIQDLERKVQQLVEQLMLLRQQVTYLQRENSRAKSNISQIANHINRR
jgi:outer membrane murein-binding lipoprotein Lpp